MPTVQIMELPEATMTDLERVGTLLFHPERPYVAMVVGPRQARLVARAVDMMLGPVGGAQVLDWPFKYRLVDPSTAAEIVKCIREYNRRLGER